MNILNKLLDFVLLPIICIGCYLRLLDAFGSFNLNYVLMALIVVYSLKAIFLEKDGYSRFSLGIIGIALLLLALFECAIYWRSSYRPNSIYALVEILSVFLFYCFIKFNVIKGTRQLTGLFTGMLVIALLNSAGAMMRFLPMWWKLKGLGFQDMTYFKDNLLYGDWIVNSLLLLPYPAILLFRFKEKKVRTILLSAAIAIVMLPLLLSFSRGAYIAVFCFAVITAVIFIQQRLLPAGRLIYLGIPILGLMILAALPFIRSISSAASMFQTESQSRSVQSRKQIWIQSLNVSGKHSLLGAGSYNYALAYQSNSVQDNTKRFIRTPQNTLIGITAEKGILGLAAYIFVFLACLYTARQVFMRAEENYYKAAAAILSIAAITVSIYLFTYYAALGNQGTAALTVVLLAGIEIMKKNQAIKTAHQ